VTYLPDLQLAGEAEPDAHWEARAVAEPAFRWWPLGAGLVLVAAAAWLLRLSWDSLTASHPAHLVTLFATAGAGVVLVYIAVFQPPHGGQSHRKLWLGRVALVGGAAALVSVLAWLEPLPADALAVDALRSDAVVQVDDTSTRIVLRPVASPRRTGLVFYPGAKVDPRAYAHVLRPVAAAGFPVTILKVPYNLAFLAPNAAERPFESVEDGVGRWVVGGHSLGGTVAARFASRNPVDGLLLWASYPGSDLSALTVDVLSVSGTNDGLATPAEIDASRADLPPSAQFVAVEGAVHAFFGNYGTQPGDGLPTVSRNDAQAQIVMATIAQLNRIDAVVKPGEPL
jgi:hypothetical protein